MHGMLTPVCIHLRIQPGNRAHSRTSGISSACQAIKPMSSPASVPHSKRAAPYSIRGGGVTTPELTATIGSTPTTTNTATTAPSPGTPSNLRVTATTSSTITLGWAGPANASYQVLRSGIQIATVTGRAFTDQGLFKNTPYIYSIRGNGVTTPQITATIS